MSATYTPTARCVHCTWSTDVDDQEALREQRDVHELMHPGGTVLVGDEDRTARGTPVIETHSVRASERWKPSGPARRTNGDSNGKRPRGYWTREKVIEAIQAFHAEHGRAPAHKDLRSPMPTDPTIRRFFATMNAAIEVAGFEPQPAGHRRSGSGQKSEAVPPPAAEPEPVEPAVREEGAKDSRKYSGTIPESDSLVELAQRVTDLTARRREVLVELNLIDEALREALGACQDALNAAEGEVAA